METAMEIMTKFFDGVIVLHGWITSATMAVQGWFDLGWTQGTVSMFIGIIMFFTMIQLLGMAAAALGIDLSSSESPKPKSSWFSFSSSNRTIRKAYQSNGWAVVEYSDGRGTSYDGALAGWSADHVSIVNSYGDTYHYDTQGNAF